jgi:hypothetical protein
MCIVAIGGIEFGNRRQPVLGKLIAVADLRLMNTCAFKSFIGYAMKVENTEILRRRLGPPLLTIAVWDIKKCTT